MLAIAWLLNDLFFGDHFWAGFLIESVVFFAIAAVAGLLAYRAVQAGSPPSPDLAIEEGKRIQRDARSRGRPRRPRSRRPVNEQRPRSTAAPASRSRDPPRRRPAAPRARSAPTSSASAKSSVTSVEALRGRVNELTDWRRQVREHRRELIIGAAVVGFAVGGLMALRRALSAPASRRRAFISVGLDANVTSASGSPPSVAWRTGGGPNDSRCDSDRLASRVPVASGAPPCREAVLPRSL